MRATTPSTSARSAAIPNANPDEAAWREEPITEPLFRERDAEEATVDIVITDEEPPTQSVPPWPRRR